MISIFRSIVVPSNKDIKSRLVVQINVLSNYQKDKGSIHMNMVVT